MFSPTTSPFGYSSFQKEESFRFLCFDPPPHNLLIFDLLLFYPSFALNASAYIRICFTMASRPLLRVGERCSCRPI